MTGLANVTKALRAAVAPANTSTDANSADEEFESTRAEVEKVGQLLNELRQKGTAALAQLERHEADLARAALDAETGTDANGYDRLETKIERERADLARLQAAITAAAEQKHEAEQKLHRLRVEGKVRLVKRQGTGPPHLPNTNCNSRARAQRVWKLPSWRLWTPK